MHLEDLDLESLQHNPYDNLMHNTFCYGHKFPPCPLPYKIRTHVSLSPPSFLPLSAPANFTVRFVSVLSIFGNTPALHQGIQIRLRLLRGCKLSPGRLPKILPAVTFPPTTRCGWY